MPYEATEIDGHWVGQEKSIYDKFTQFALIATKQAVLSSGWEFQKKHAFGPDN